VIDEVEERAGDDAADERRDAEQQGLSTRAGSLPCL
jgi:hypothetical protein